MKGKSVTMDKDGYPSDECLRYLRRIAKDPKRIEEMFRLIIEAWDYKYAGYYRRRGRKIWLSTAGWSGNESLIGAIDGSFNWFITAYSWKRGGHYVFLLPRFVAVSGLPKGGE